MTISTSHHHRSEHAQVKKNKKPGTLKPAINLAMKPNASKSDRINQRKQRVAHQTAQLKETRSVLDASLPLTVAVAVFSGSVDVSSLWLSLTGTELVNGHNIALVNTSGRQEETSRGRWFQFVMASDRFDITAVLDSAKTADLVLAVFDGSARVSHDASCFDAQGYRLLTALKMQGLPQRVFGCTFGGPLDPKSEKTAIRFFESEFTDDGKLHKWVGEICIRSQITPTLQRHLINVHPVVPDVHTWRSNQGYMLVDKSEYQAETDTLAVCGFVKGLGFAAGKAVHVTGHCRPFKVTRIVSNDGCCWDQTQVIAENSDPYLSDVLVPIRPAEEGEQTWPTIEEEIQAARELRRVRVPAGLATDVEVAWLGEDCGKVEDWEDGEEAEEEEVEEEEAEEEEAEEEERLELRSREEMDLPDEVDTPTNIPAKVRFQKYRGLRSLRTSEWDPYEELPVEFSQIWEFDNPEITARRGIETLAKLGAGTRGKYCTIYLQGGNWSERSIDRPLVLSTLLDYETKVTLMNCKMQRLPEAAETEMPSKAVVTIQCGFRRFPIKPAYSEFIKSRGVDDRLTKYFRKVPTADTVSSTLVSFYAPTVFGYTPALLFNSNMELSMWGSVNGCQPNRPIVLKRILLTGYVVKAQKRGATIRYMFFRPSDILWFRPVELVTKKGLRGTIIEPLGTKGHMKCRFSSILTHDDIVCMPLYKRVFPKWYPPTWGSPEERSPDRSTMMEL